MWLNGNDHNLSYKTPFCMESIVFESLPIVGLNSNIVGFFFHVQVLVPSMYTKV